MPGGELPTSPPAFGGDLELVHSLGRRFGCPGSRSGWICQERSRAQSAAVPSCPGLLAGWAAGRGGRRCCLGIAGQAGNPQLGAAGPVWWAGVPLGVVGCPAGGVDGDVSACLFLGADVPLHLPGGFLSPDEIHSGLPAREAGV